jgi:hypothetical protein
VVEEKEIKKTLIVFIIALLVGGYIYFYERKAPTTEERVEKAQRVFDFDSEDVRRLSLRKGDCLIVCEKTEEEWIITEPLKVKADKSKVEGIISVLEFLRVERKLEQKAGEKLETVEFGLDEPRMEVIIDVEGESLTFIIGDDSPVGRNMYAMCKDRGEVILVRKSLFDDLGKNVEDLRVVENLEKDLE